MFESLVFVLFTIFPPPPLFPPVFCPPPVISVPPTPFTGCVAPLKESGIFLLPRLNVKR
jgi:hypothetical protein